MGYKSAKRKSEYQSAWVANRRSRWLKDNGPCKHCGTWDRLEVNHINSSEKLSHRIWSWNEKRRLLELAKCQVLCNACHLMKGILYGDIQGVKHGSMNRYKKGCRCHMCRKAKGERRFSA